MDAFFGEDDGAGQKRHPTEEDDLQVLHKAKKPKSSNIAKVMTGYIECIFSNILESFQNKKTARMLLRMHSIQLI